MLHLLSFLIVCVNSVVPVHQWAAPSFFASECDEAAETTIDNCAVELKKMGVFTATAKQVAITDIRSRTQIHFIQMCEAYARFNRCLGPTTLKTVCFPVEPFKSKYAVVDSALDYVCGTGYEGMLSNWECYLKVAAHDEISRCEKSFVELATRQEAMYNEYSLGAGACFALQTYVDCIRPGIEEACGTTSFHTVVQAIEKPVHVYLPFCMLSSAPTIGTIVSLLMTMIIFFI